MPSLLEMRGITKRFPGVLALDHVSFDLRSGEVHAIVGENGAGKSTLMNILGGVYPSGTYDGEIAIDGEVQQFHGVRAAEDAGIAVVHQELSLIPEFSIADNIFLGREPRRLGVIDHDAIHTRARLFLEDLQLALDPHVPVENLGIGQQHLVEIAKALSRNARILVLDEPTAALTETESEILFGILERLRAAGAGIIYISHKLAEVFRIANRVTVLRDGRCVSTDPATDLTAPALIARMVGREVPSFGAQWRGGSLAADIVFEAKNVTVTDAVDNVTLSVHRGEILGMAGLLGAGRSELLMAIFGAHPARTAGGFSVDGKEIPIRQPSDAIKAGIAFVTEERKRFGLFLDHSVMMNLTLAAIRNIDDEAAVAQHAVDDMHIKTLSLDADVATLSGGNQQKVVLGKWLLTKPKVLLLDEPTRGIDVGAKQEIYTEIARLAAEGMAIVLVSSELPEVLGLSDRVLVLHEGRVTGEFDRVDATAEAVMACAMGHARRMTA
ncbi:MAG TPA: sugar ABC transporter ATP-binding protein [Thermoanaerobaculia bacterium]|jgi:D-xylose transport system ATP-binding protein